jgi:hypothetical protein
MNKTYISDNAAFEAVLNSLAITENCYLLSEELDGALCIFEFITEWLRYTCYFDMELSEVVGVDCVPVVAGELPADIVDTDENEDEAA